MNPLAQFSAKVHVQGIPSEWDVNDITRRFAIAGRLETTHVIRDNLGKSTGRAVLTFASKDAAEKAIKSFDNQAIENQVCKVKPFFENKEQE